jgi:phosphoketolase
MIFLRDNVLLESELQLDHVKPRLLGMLEPPPS